MIKEKTCYIALSPSKEEKESQSGGRGEEFKLPDGNIIRVRFNPCSPSRRMLNFYRIRLIAWSRTAQSA